MRWLRTISKVAVNSIRVICPELSGQRICG